MTGFNIDPEALENAIKKLEDARDKAGDMGKDAEALLPAELTAGDRVTAEAYNKFKGLAAGDTGSMAASATEIEKKLSEKIEAYRATLEEYRRAEDAATVDAGRVNGQA